uniref:NADH dehydrogenase subunit 6 n=1 Tax=Cacopsylla melanoneura TaxID=428564 RepID=A0A8D9FAT8_9HEMI
MRCITFFLASLVFCLSLFVNASLTSFRFCFMCVISSSINFILLSDEVVLLSLFLGLFCSSVVLFFPSFSFVGVFFNVLSLTALSGFFRVVDSTVSDFSFSLGELTTFNTSCSLIPPTFLSFNVSLFVCTVSHSSVMISGVVCRAGPVLL